MCVTFYALYKSNRGKKSKMSEDMTTSETFANGNNDKPIEEPDQVVSPDMLYKLSKKIAQLTKVIYSLNTKNDDLEVDLEAVRNTYEDKLQICQEQLQIAQNHAILQNGDVSPGKIHE